MDLNRLDEPFGADDIEWRAQSCGKSNSGKFWVSVLAYVTNRAIMKRLDEVCGKGNWKNEFKDSGKAIECGISIRVDGEWVTKWDAAEETNIEGVKGGRSGAMKRAAVQWGIGRYLYDLESAWGNVEPNGKNNQKTKQNEWFKWSPPKLPQWALPNKKAHQQVKQQANGFNPDECLKRFTSSASSANQAMIKTLFGQCWTELAQYQEHQGKAKEVYDIRMSELTTPES